MEKCKAMYSLVVLITKNVNKNRGSQVNSQKVKRSQRRKNDREWLWKVTKRKEGGKERSACYGIKPNQCETNNTIPNALEITFFLGQKRQRKTTPKHPHPSQDT